MVRLLCILILLTLDCTVVLCSFVSLLHYLAIQPSRLQGCSNKISCQLSVVTEWVKRVKVHPWSRNWLRTKKQNVNIYDAFNKSDSQNVPRMSYMLAYTVASKQRRPYTFDRRMRPDFPITV